MSCLTFDDGEVFSNQQCVGAMGTGCSLGDIGLMPVVLLQGPEPRDTDGHFSVFCQCGSEALVP